MKTELTLESAPRDSGELLKLSRAARCRLHELLQEEFDDETKTDHKTFKTLSPSAQSVVLADMLKDMDEEDEQTKNDKFIVLGVPLPLRKKDDAENRRRWDAFSNGIQIMLNSLNNDGFRPQILNIQGHGLLVLGDRQQLEPSVVPVNLSSLLQSVVKERVEEAEQEGSKKESLILSSIIEKLQARTTPLSSKEDLQRVVSEVIPSIEDKESFEKFVREEHESHAKECPLEGECVLDKILTSVLAALEQHKMNLC